MSLYHSVREKNIGEQSVYEKFMELWNRKPVKIRKILQKNYKKNFVKKRLTFIAKSDILAKQSGNGHANGVLAQLGEHLPYKQRVTGSSPVGPIMAE